MSTDRHEEGGLIKKLEAPTEDRSDVDISSAAITTTSTTSTSTSTTNTASARAPVGFMHLPGELQNRIYDLAALPNNVNGELDRSTKYIHFPTTWNNRPKFNAKPLTTTLFLASKRIRHELLTRIFSTSDLEIFIPQPQSQNDKQTYLLRPMAWIAGILHDSHGCKDVFKDLRIRLVFGIWDSVEALLPLAEMVRVYGVQVRVVEQHAVESVYTEAKKEGCRIFLQMASYAVQQRTVRKILEVALDMHGQPDHGSLAALEVEFEKVIKAPEVRKAIANSKTGQLRIKRKREEKLEAEREEKRQRQLDQAGRAAVDRTAPMLYRLQPFLLDGLGQSTAMGGQYHSTGATATERDDDDSMSD